MLELEKRRQVKDWGTGQPGELGDLQVQTHSRSTMASEAAPQLYQQLTLRLQELEVRGEELTCLGKCAGHSLQCCWRTRLALNNGKRSIG